MDRREALKALVSLPAVARISVADLKPNDVIVVECDRAITNDQAERLRGDLQKLWPGRKIAVLDPSLHLKVVQG